MTSAAQANRGQCMTSGVPALDTVLGGGIPKGASVFICGLPGAGKTVLSEQALFANARRSESVLYVTTLSEPPVKLLRFSRSFEFFRPELLERNVRYADVGDALRSGGPAACLEELSALLQQHRPDFLVLDSFKVFREHFEEDRTFRAFVAEVMILFATWEVTALLVGEYSFDEIATEPEFAIADGIIHLSGTEEELKQKRYLNVIKMRGADAFFGRHSYEIDESGFTVYPRMLPRVQGQYTVSEERRGSVIEGLNDMMCGGAHEGSVLLVCGSTGSGKTLTALSFAVQAAADGVKTLIVAFEESPNQLLRNCEQLGWPVADAYEQGTLSIRHVAPSELDLDRHALSIKDEADRTGARLVIIDSVTAFDDASNDEAVLTNYLWALADHFRRTGTTLVLVTEGDPSGNNFGPRMNRNISYLADSIIVLQLAETTGVMQRRIHVRKMRGSDHVKELRELRIERGSVTIRAT